MNFCRPKMYQKNIFSIDYNLLQKKGIEYLIFDLDNTLGLINEKVCNEKTKKFLENLNRTFTIIVASNSKYERVYEFTKNLPVVFLSFSIKPSRKLYHFVKKNFTDDMCKVCLIGDQLMTDITLGNRFSMYTILIDPLGIKDLKITKFNRYLEKIMMKKMNMKWGSYYEEN